MSRSGRKKEKHGRSGDLSLDNCNDGTAARTRPLSFDEIIIMRKNKKSPEEVKEGATGAGNISGDCTIENVSNHRESERHHRHNKDSSHGVDKHMSQEFVKLGSRGKDDGIPPNDSNSVRRRERESRESENKLRDDSLAKPKHRETLRSEIRLKDGSLAKENNTGESRRSEIKLKAEMKEKFTKDKGKVDTKILGLGKIYEQLSENSKDEAIKKHSRDLTGKNRHEGRSEEKSERESKRKHRSGDDEKNGDRNAVKKQELGKRRDSDISERKERKESPKSRYGESRLKRRRSRSREHEERNRRSISVSPKAHKHTSYHGREHEELSAHSSKGRSERHHSDIDRSKGTSNGSNSHYRRHGGSTSGLGGYSPRKRRTDAAVKTPSPVNRSPEKKSAKWDVAPTETNTISDSVPSTFQMSNQNASSNEHEVVRATPVTSTAVKPLDVASVTASLTKQNISIDSLQLTQATRPLRSLYVDNVPASVSEKAVIECLNNFLLSSGVNQTRGSQPCISCVKDKGQALIEFLTPEDATAALSCDGSSFFGSILKIRRPKDFVEVAGNLTDFRSPVKVV
ncbi:hypothetical protein Pint_25124 [Pistacia integerrima]|uniref:Uncharacterized protein n=1 Tax=Pistacia integerrima TaxID=434235 RepID=A0ACC0YD84_9ROSI|nr:hypothetical protein Pint_25124 [Pistacia integerrima]